MKRNNKKGFTIVELVIVIVVIAILAAVLIPTFSNVIEKAQKSANLQQAKNFYTLVEANTVAGAEEGKYTFSMGKDGLVVKNSDVTQHETPDVLLKKLFGDDFNGFKGAKIGIESNTALNQGAEWTIKAIYFQAKGNSHWVKIDLVNGTLADYIAARPTSNYVEGEWN